MVYFFFTLSRLIIFCHILCLTLGLECFVCDSQEKNDEKCTTTVRQCDPEIHDACTTNVRWGVTLYWLPAVKRIHYISKACDTLHDCLARKRRMESRCYRDWWADWACEDCCTGDRCNYYVTLSATGSRSNGIMAMAALVLLTVVWI